MGVFCYGMKLRGSHFGIWPRGAATSLFGHAVESAGICRVKTGVYV